MMGAPSATVPVEKKEKKKVHHRQVNKDMFRKGELSKRHKGSQVCFLIQINLAKYVNSKQ